MDLKPHDDVIRVSSSICFQLLIIGVDMDKWEALGYITAIFNPLPSGIIAGYILHTEKKYKKTGKIVTALSVIWFALLAAIIYMVKW